MDVKLPSLGGADMGPDSQWPGGLALNTQGRFVAGASAQQATRAGGGLLLPELGGPTISPPAQRPRAQLRGPVAVPPAGSVRTPKFSGVLDQLDRGGSTVTSASRSPCEPRRLIKKRGLPTRLAPIVRATPSRPVQVQGQAAAARAPPTVAPVLAPVSSATDSDEAAPARSARKRKKKKKKKKAKKAKKSKPGHHPTTSVSSAVSYSSAEHTSIQQAKERDQRRQNVSVHGPTPAHKRAGDSADMPTVDALFEAARNGRYEEVKRMFSDGVQPDVTDSFGNTLLFTAAQNGLKRLVKICLRQGANINHQNCSGMTPAHLSFQYGNTSLGYYLLSKGADNKLQDGKGRTCMDMNTR